MSKPFAPATTYAPPTGPTAAPNFAPISQAANFQPIGSVRAGTPQWNPNGNRPVQLSPPGGGTLFSKLHPQGGPFSQTGMNAATGGLGLDPAGLFGHSTFSVQNHLDPAGLFSGAAHLKGKIDPVTGTVDVKGKGAKYDDAFTNYLRTGMNAPTGGKGAFKHLKHQIEALRNSGWQYSPPTSGGGG